MWMFKIIPLAVCLVTASSWAQMRCQDALLYKDSTVLFFKNSSESFRPVPVPTENSSHQLMDSIYSMQLRFRDLGVDNLKLGKNLASEWKTSTGRVIPMEGLYASLSLVHKAASVLRLSQSSSWEVSLRIQRLVIEALGQRWSEYIEFLTPQIQSSLPKQFHTEIISKARMIQVGEELLKAVDIDSTHSIPYLAGYSIYSAKHVYFDSGLTQVVKLADGRVISVAPFLGLHEGIEKALIDVLELSEKSYLRTHQIAQRLEKELVEAHNITWNEYQHQVMARELERVDTAEVQSVPSDLDLTPYVDYQDFKLIETMKKTMVIPAWQLKEKEKEKEKEKQK